MNRQEKLLSRGFKDEKHLEDFLANCVDKAWKEELTEYYSEKRLKNLKLKKLLRMKKLKKKNSKGELLI